MNITAIATKHLACQRGGEIIVADANFEVAAGHALLLRGPNGSGKTTLLRTVAGFLAPASGQIVVRQNAGDSEWQPDAAHYIGHANGIKGRLSVLENVRFWQRYYGDAPNHPETARQTEGHPGNAAEITQDRRVNPPTDPGERQAGSRVTGDMHPGSRGNNTLQFAEAALDAFGLLHLADYRAAHLSQGQARRLGLARLVAAKRPIWLLDEPSVSLDTSSTRMLEAAIAAHLASGGMAIIATHGDINVPSAAVLTLGKAAA